MKVVIATPFYPPEQGVLGVYAEGLVGAFEKRGDTVTVVPFGETKSLPPVLRHMAYFSRILTIAPGASFVLALDTWSVGIPALFAAKIRHVPFVVRIGGDYLWEAYTERTHEKIRLSEFYLQQRRYSLKERLIFTANKYLLKHADVIFFNTKFQEKIWREAYGLAHVRTRVLENYYPPVAMQEAEGKTFVSGGRELFFKNYGVLEKVFEGVRAKIPAAQLDTRGLVHEEHRGRLTNAYAVIIPAISEVGSNTVIDGVALGKPFIMSDDTGTSERLNDCGIFIDTRSEEKMTAAVESLLDASVYNRLRENIRAFSFTHSWDDIVEEIRSAL